MNVVGMSVARPVRLAAPNPKARAACEIAGSTVAGAGLGYLGASAGAQAGFTAGLLLAPTNSGLSGLLVWGVNGARLGLLVGGAAGLAGGIMLGAWAAEKAYDHYHH